MMAALGEQMSGGDGYISDDSSFYGLRYLQNPLALVGYSS